MKPWTKITRADGRYILTMDRPGRLGADDAYLLTLLRQGRLAGEAARVAAELAAPGASPPVPPSEEKPKPVAIDDVETWNAWAREVCAAWGRSAPRTEPS